MSNDALASLFDVSLTMDHDEEEGKDINQI
jgi:hypothetical protein